MFEEFVASLVNCESNVISYQPDCSTVNWFDAKVAFLTSDDENWIVASVDTVWVTELVAINCDP